MRESLIQDAIIRPILQIHKMPPQPLRERCGKIVLVCYVLQDKVLTKTNKKMRRAIWRRRPGVAARALSLPPAPSLDNGHATRGHVHTAHVLRCQRRLRRFPRAVLFTCVCEYVRTAHNSFEIIEQLDFSFSLVPRTCLVNRRRPQ